MSDEILISAENVSKKFCRSLKRSLWYGVQDVASALNPLDSAKNPEDFQSATSTPLRNDEFWAVRDVSFELRRGECLGLIGHNGAGKSTLLKILNGLIRPDTGRITMRGRVAALIELNAGFNLILTGRENIFNQASLLGFTREEALEKFDAIVEFAEIGDFLDMPVQNYSSGMRVRLGFAVAVQMEPDILIIDEVLAVGDVAFRAKCLNAISEIIASCAVIFVSHSMPQVFRVSSDVLLLARGQTSYYGKDIGFGVGKYLSKQGEVASKLIGGNGVLVEGVELTSSEGEVTDGGGLLVVQYGESLRLRAQLRVEPHIGSVRLQFVFWNAEMLPVIDVMTDSLQGYPVRFNDIGVEVVEAEIPRLELNAGKYAISVHVTADDLSRSHCRLDNAAHLVVCAPTASGAHCLSVARWTQDHPLLTS